MSGRFSEAQFPPIRRFTIGNLKHADINELEIPAKLLQIGHRIFKVGHVNLLNDQEMTRYGIRMGWGSCGYHFLKAFPHREVEVPFNTYQQKTLPDGTKATHSNGSAIMEPVQIMVKDPVTRTDHEYAEIARVVFTALSEQNPDRLMGVDSFKNEDGDRELAGLYINLGELDFEESDGDDVDAPWTNWEVPYELAAQYFGELELPSAPVSSSSTVIANEDPISMPASSISREIYTPSPAINPDELDPIQRELDGEVQEAISAQPDQSTQKLGSPREWPKVETDYIRTRSPLIAPRARRTERDLIQRPSTSSPRNWSPVEAMPGFRSRS